MYIIAIYIRLWILVPLIMSRRAWSLLEDVKDVHGHNHQSSNVLFSPRCLPNEVWEHCGSSSCWEYTCADLVYPHPYPRPCTKDCRQGCKCAQGYYRSSDGRCVDELTCFLCGYNENWYEPEENVHILKNCPQDVTCDALQTLLHYNSTPGDAQRQNCTTGYCYCIEGTVRTSRGHCVSDLSCLKCPGPNEVYDGCGSSSCWELTCDQANWTMEERNSRPCTLDCHSGCKCFLGYYRKDDDGCVTFDHCF